MFQLFLTSITSNKKDSLIYAILFEGFIWDWQWLNDVINCALLFPRLWGGFYEKKRYEKNVNAFVCLHACLGSKVKGQTHIYRDSEVFDSQHSTNHIFPRPIFFACQIFAYLEFNQSEVFRIWMLSSHVLLCRFGKSDVFDIQLAS